MKLNRFTAFATALLMASAASNVAAQDARAELAQKIAAAQGLTELFDQQLAHQRDATKDFAKKIFEQAIADGGGQANPRAQAAFEKLGARAGELFTGKEVAAAWVTHYGKNLSTQDLQAILSYYESPIGLKDVAATRAAMSAFSSWMAQEAQKRATDLLKDFVAELQEARQ